MGQQIVHRLLISFPALLGVLFLCFCLLQVVPADPAMIIAGPDAKAETIAAIRLELGLDRSIAVQFFEYILRVLRGDLGRSIISNRMVSEELAMTIGPTVELMLGAMLIAVPSGLALGTLAAVNRGRLADRVIMACSVAGVSMPVFFIGLILIQYVGFKWALLPFTGRTGPIWDGGLPSLILPATTLGLVLVGPIARLTRTAVLEVLGADFVRTARAKGLRDAGKTTLLRLLAGVTAPSVGRVRVAGRIAPLISIGVGFHPELSGRENIVVNGTVLGLTRARLAEVTPDIIAFSGLADDVLDTPVKLYSSGMLLRLAFAVAVHTDPDVMLVDELLAVGDLAFQQRCLARMAELRARGVTVVLVSHSVFTIREVCDRAIVLSAGRKVFDGPAEEAVRVHQRLLGGDAAESGSEAAAVAVRPVRGRRVRRRGGRAGARRALPAAGDARGPPGPGRPPRHVHRLRRGRRHRLPDALRRAPPPPHPRRRRAGAGSRSASPPPSAPAPTSSPSRSWATRAARSWPTTSTAPSSGSPATPDPDVHGPAPLQIGVRVR